MRRLGVIAAGLLLLAACTGDDDSETVTAGSEPTSTTSGSSTTEGTAAATTTTLIEGGEALEPIDVSELESDPGWEPRPDDPAAVDEFNAYVADGPKPYADSALDLAAVYLGLQEPEEGGRVEAAVEDVDAGTRVTLLESGIADDSLAAVLTQFLFEPADGGVLRLVNVNRQFSCQPGRGHEDFSTEPCV